MAASLAATPSIEAAMGLKRIKTNTPLTTPRSTRNSTRPRQRSTTGSPCTAASIPSRYQTFFYSTSENMGFNSQATRFSEHLNVQDTPGPGSYTTQATTLEKYSTSFSKKGTGGLASKNVRFSKLKQPYGVGPGSYDPQLLKKHRDFNKAKVSGNFHPPIAVRTAAAEQSPAPNSYDLSGVEAKRNNLITAEAAFKSRTNRTAYLLHCLQNPAPGQYSVSDQLLHPTVCSYKSVFNSKSGRGITRTQKGPGPADYSPYKGQNRPRIVPYFRHKHYLCFSAPAMPLPPIPPPPGPGHYNIQSKMTMADRKLPVSDAVFKSTTSRWMGSSNLNSENEPGPGSYDTAEVERKKSYLFNTHKKWV